MLLFRFEWLESNSVWWSVIDTFLSIETLYFSFQANLHLQLKKRSFLLAQIRPIEARILQDGTRKEQDVILLDLPSNYLSIARVFSPSLCTSHPKQATRVYPSGILINQQPSLFIVNFRSSLSFTRSFHPYHRIILFLSSSLN